MLNLSASINAAAGPARPRSRASRRLTAGSSSRESKRGWCLRCIRILLAGQRFAGWPAGCVQAGPGRGGLARPVRPRAGPSTTRCTTCCPHLMQDPPPPSQQTDTRMLVIWLTCAAAWTLAAAAPDMAHAQPFAARKLKQVITNAGGASNAGGGGLSGAKCQVHVNACVQCLEDENAVTCQAGCAAASHAFTRPVPHTAGVGAAASSALRFRLDARRRLHALVTALLLLLLCGCRHCTAQTASSAALASSHAANVRHLGLGHSDARRQVPTRRSSLHVDSCVCADATADVDQCLIDNGGCDVNANCINNPSGSPACECRPGFTGNGLSCTGAWGVAVRPVRLPSAAGGKGLLASSKQTMVLGPGTQQRILADLHIQVCNL